MAVMYLIFAIMSVLFAENEGSKCGFASEWKNNGPYDYKLICLTKSITFQEAEAECNEYHDHSHLVSIHSAEENSFVNGLITDQIGEWDLMWIGLFRDNPDSEFKWTDGTPVDYGNWASKQPDNYYGHPTLSPENCVHMYIRREKGFWPTDKEWNDIKCDYDPTHFFVCKKKKRSLKQ